MRALDPALRLGSEGLTGGDVVAAAGLEIRVLATPGHTSDSLSFLVADDGGTAVLTGDTVLGRGTTVVAHPDGRLGAYLDSLRDLAELAPGTVVLPGHGPELPDAGAAARAYLAHRERRLAQVRAALEQLGPDATSRQVVEIVYVDVDRALWRAASNCPCGRNWSTCAVSAPGSASRRSAVRDRPRRVRRPSGPWTAGRS